VCAGFAVGRTIFQEPARQWLCGAIDDDALTRAIRGNFEALIDRWHEARGLPSEREAAA
jgi:5-dehydro-2-deoxygluconokinase